MFAGLFGTTLEAAEKVTKVGTFEGSLPAWARDPLLAGILDDGNVVKGVQSQFVIGDLKHYALNDQESGRNAVNVNKRVRIEPHLDGLHQFAASMRHSAGEIITCTVWGTTDGR